MDWSTTTLAWRRLIGKVYLVKQLVSKAIEITPAMGHSRGLLANRQRIRQPCVFFESWLGRIKTGTSMIEVSPPGPHWG